jgi:hypothetical protein
MRIHHRQQMLAVDFFTVETMCCSGCWLCRRCARECAKRGPTTVNSDPTPTNDRRKNEPEIFDFLPVLRPSTTSANRRLQPLGHLTMTSVSKPARSIPQGLRR